MRVSISALAFVALLAGCNNAGTDLDFSTSRTGTVSVLVYLDRDASRSLTPPVDTVYAGARVALLSRGSGDTIRTVTSGADGVAQFETVPFGDYRVTAALGGLGDSLLIGDIATPDVQLSLHDSTANAVVRLAYPEVSIRHLRELPVGKRVVVRGYILVGVQQFRDTTSHAADSSGSIRMTRVSLRGFSGNSPGDSVTALGTIATRLGQPVLDRALLTRIGIQPPPVAAAVATGTAATAANGQLDAALVQITAATITDTVSLTPDFKVTVSDGSGSLDIVLDGNLNFPHTNFRPTGHITVRGVLVPNGAGGWVLKPRDGGDVLLF
jgi:hypothetical protein